MTENESLPVDVLESLRRGDAIDAVRRLSEATGLGLKEAMAVVEAHQRARPASSGGAASRELPAAVVAALQRGEKLVAIKLLMAQGNLGLKEAKDAVDGYVRDQAPVLGGTFSTRFPVEVLAALQRGDKIKAIKLLREHRKIGLKEARDAVEEHLRGAAPVAGHRPTVERPRSSKVIWWVAGLALAGYAAYNFLGHAG